MPDSIMERVTMMDGVTITNKHSAGFFIKKPTIIVILVAFFAVLLLTTLIVYKTSTCTEQTITCNRYEKYLNCKEQNYDHTTTPIRTSKPTNSTTIVTSAMPSINMSDYVTTATNQNAKTPRDVRLPKTIEPMQYDLRLIANVRESNFTFHGNVKILIRVLRETNEIVLHAHNLFIHQNVLLKTNYSILSVNEIEFVDDNQLLVIHVNNGLTPGRYELSINFVGVLNDHMQGFYKSSYMVNNTKRWIAATQFQPTDARRAFPCFDEPAMKAKFRISIGRPKHMLAISNMPKFQPKVNIAHPSNDFEWDHFQTSYPMSTYLVAFCIVDFANVTDGRVSIWARKDAIEQAQYALTIAPNILKYFEQYFAIEFPLPKIDMIALPDFAAGAMENWGLITYRYKLLHGETAVLFKKGISSKLNQLGVASVIAHELAHQWFGNLVTPTWWSDLWLNEGFASYVEYIGVNAVEPTWEVLKFIVVDDLHSVFALDSQKSSHKISVAVHRPEEINEIFDRISYAKGSSIIRMMDHFLTAQVFTSALTNYLNARKYGNAEQNDLWQSLSDVAHDENVLDKSVSVKEIMDTWTLQVGYPVVQVTRNYAGTSARLEQRRFLIDSNETDDTLWWIPITYAQNRRDFDDTKVRVWMKREKQIRIDALDKDKWLIVNTQQTGYYRVNYDLHNWRLITHALITDHQVIDTINRAQLLNDAMNLARAGLLAYDVALNITTYLRNERHYVPWCSGINEFSYLNDMFKRNEDYIYLKNYMLHLINDTYTDVGFVENDSDALVRSFLRVDILYWACYLSHSHCVREALLLFNRWMADPDPDTNNPIPANLKSVVYCTAIEKGTEIEWDFAWKRYVRANVGTEKEILLNALGCSRELWVLSRYLSWTIKENAGIRKQDVPRVFRAVSQNVIGQSLAFDFLRMQWTNVKKYLGSALTVINSILKVITMSLNTEFELKDFIEFAERYDLSESARTIQQQIEKVESNVKWMKRNSKPIRTWLSDYLQAKSVL